MYLLWPDAPRSREEVAETVLGSLAGELLDLGPLRLSIDVRDPESDIPAPVPTPEGEVPADALVSLWLDALDQRAPYEECWGPPPAAWPDIRSWSRCTATTEGINGRCRATGPMVCARPAS